MSSLGRIVEAWTDLISTFAIGQTLNQFGSVQTWLMLHLWRVVISDSRASTYNIPLISPPYYLDIVTGTLCFYFIKNKKYYRISYFSSRFSLPHSTPLNST